MDRLQVLVTKAFLFRIESIKLFIYNVVKKFPTVLACLTVSLVHTEY
jgi:hypothetical protein